MTKCKTRQETEPLEAYCQSLLGPHSMKELTRVPVTESQETERKKSSGSTQQAANFGQQQGPTSIRRKWVAKKRLRFPQMKKTSLKSMYLTSKAVVSRNIGDTVSPPTPNDSKAFPELRRRVILSLLTTVKQKNTLQISNSSHSAVSRRTSLTLTVPSHSAAALRAGSSTPTCSSSKSLSLHTNKQILSLVRVESQHHDTVNSPSPCDADMTPPDFLPALTTSQNGLQLPSQVDRRYQRTENNHSRGVSRDDHNNWRDYSSLHLWVTNLPINVTTLQVWRNFKKYGELFSIILNDNGGQYSSRSASICYKPPPADAFWQQRGGLCYQHGDKTSRLVQVRLDRKQFPKHEVPSPIRPKVMYNEEHTLVGDSIEFGVLIESSSFMALKTRKSGPECNVRFHLDLRKQEITVYFPSAVRSENSGLVVREYRFKVALDQNFILSQVETAGNDLVLLLEIDKPPPYSKKLSEAATGSHVDNARRWLAEDLWARQTDITDMKDAHDSIRKAPVSVKNSFASIDIGRWLAFRLTFPKTDSNRNTLANIQSALRDFNILIKDQTQLEVRTATAADEPILWKVLDEQKTAEYGTASSSLQDLMSSDTTLSFSVRYQLEVCVSHGYLSEYNIDHNFLRHLANLPPSKALQYLKAVDVRGKRFLRPADIFDDLEFRKPVRQPKLPENCIEIHQATITATTIYFNTPSVEVTNRVIRQYKQHADRFLRVRFEDDDYRGNSKLWSSVNNKMTNIFARVRRSMKEGIVLGDRLYKFLAWGNSQLREHGAYFFADLPGVITAGNIRAKMGEFSKEKIVAKRAARMGQCFSTTRSLACRIPRVYESVCIPDTRTPDNKYIFTDGVGRMSEMIAHLAGIQMGIKNDVPSVIQFRLGGCKGILAIDPSMPGVIELKVRDSQFKFASASNDLEIIRCSHFATADLNRQIILVLSELGVPDCVFLTKQEELIEDINNAMKSDDAAFRALMDRVDPNLMTPVIANMIAKGRFRAVDEPFVTSVLHLWRSWNLKYLKEKAKLPVPKSAFVLGCTDETQKLRGHLDHPDYADDVPSEKKEKLLPEIFLQVTDPLTREVRVVESICVVARNPSLHRGDVRVVKAVDIPALHHLRDVVVFPQTGDRDLPSMCSGGDLDGDDFIVIWDQDLLPTVWNAAPFHYDPPVPVQAEGDVTTEQIISFFVDYMENDFLGRIAHAHLAWADDKGLDSEECLELVQLHSLSVDFPKTGVPARMERRLERVETPHFMEKKGKRYTSCKILGQLYDAVEKVNFKPEYKTSFDSRILEALVQPEQLYQQVKILKGAYDESMRQIMAQHKIKTEFEVWTTFVLDHSKKSNDFKFHEEIGRLSTALKEQYFEEIAKLMGGRDFEHLAPFAVTAYQFTQAEVDMALKRRNKTGEETDVPFISFPWVLHETLTKIAAGALRPSDDANSANEAGIRFDEEGNPLLPSLSGDLLSLQGDWLGQHHEDPLRDDVAPASRAHANGEAIQDTSPVSNGHSVTVSFSDPAANASDTIQRKLDEMRVEDSDSD